MRLVKLPLFCLSLTLLVSSPGEAARKGKKDRIADEEQQAEGPFTAKTFSGLALRGIGPAINSGRVVDFAVDPENRKHYYVATASGGVWRTTNAGTTWTPIFDDQGSYSIGCVTLDPTDRLVVWVGTGENNSQRSVGYGDGVYKSLDGGTTWERAGLEQSEHIGMITVDPRDGDTVYVAAQGPLWREGGDRGLYKTVDGGQTWDLVLDVDAQTGVSEVHFDRRDPDTLYAVAYQRARRVWTLVNGGPGSALYKSTDGGESWTKLERGLPKVEMGRIGLAVSPADPNVLYAIVEARGDAGGVFRSSDAGSNWEQRSDYVSASPQYYQELVADPLDVDRVYSLDTYLMVSDDGGRLFRRAGQSSKHVDEHALWIDPADTDYLLSGNDGGVYESFDRGTTWHFKANLPITQFYKITVDDEAPFYNVYGGTQDNYTLGGPSRTTTVHGITNREWFVTIGGDGFQPRVEPGNPDLVYSQSQYGNLRRFDRRTGEAIDIKPRAAAGEDLLRWNWDSPLVISPHSPTRLYYAAQRVFRSDDRGESWQALSGDLSRQLDRDQLEIMGRRWSIDAVARHASTSPYGSVVALSESPLVEGLIYAGTDDGLVQVLEPGSDAWWRIDSFPDVPALAYVARVEASLHDPDTLFAAFNDHKAGDFTPYLLESTDRGRTWTSIASDLPERGSVWAVVQDHVDPDLLFVGTEFGLYFTVDGGGRWVRLKGGMPVIAVRDLAVQRREDDLVAGTFGRGIFILDDFTPLRGLRQEQLEQEALLFPVKDPWMYIEARPLGGPDKGFLGDSLYNAPNPAFGAVFTYYLKEGLESLEQRRQKAEKEAAEAGEDPGRPSWEELRAEKRERAPEIELVIEDDQGKVVRRLSGPAGEGLHRISWDLRFAAPDPVRLGEEEEASFFRRPPVGPMVVPGTYRARLTRSAAGESTPLGEPRSFTPTPLGAATLPAPDREALLAFQHKTARLQRAVLGAVGSAGEAETRLAHLRQALRQTPAAPPELGDRLRRLEEQLADLRLELEGDSLRRSYNEPAAPAIVERVEVVVSGHWRTTSGPTATHRQSYALAAEAFAPVLDRLRRLVEVELEELETDFEAAGAPWTPGRVPSWRPE